MAHPRLLLSPAVLARAKARVASNHTFWQALKPRVDRANDWSTGIIAYSLAYQLTGNTAYADSAIHLIMIDVAEGMDHITEDDGYFVREILRDAAIAWDYLQPRLSAQQKTDLLAAIEAWSRWVWPETNPSRAGEWGVDDPRNNYFHGFMMTWLSGHSIQGDSPLGQTLMDQAEARFKAKVVPQMNGGFKGGYLHEGTGYGWGGSCQWMAHYLTGHWTAAGVAPAALLPVGWNGSLMLAAFHLTTPSLSRVYPGGDQARVSAAPLSDYHLASVLSVMDYLSPEDAGMVRFWFDQVYPKRDVIGSTAWMPLLWYRDDVPAMDYRTKLPTYYVMPGVGVMSTRSGWGPNDTQVVAVAGPVIEDSHQTPAGTIDLWRGTEWLLGRVLEWSHDGTDHAAPNLNVVTIDGAGYVPKQDDARILFSTDTPAATSWAGDLTDCDPSRFGELRRELLFVKPGTLVVLDRVRAQNAGALKEQRWHVLNSPSISGRQFSASAGGYTVHGTSLLPGTVSVVSESTSGGFRVKLKAPTGVALDYFLTVLEAIPTGQAETAPITLTGTGNIRTLSLGQKTVQVTLDATTGPALSLVGDTPPPSQNVPPVAHAGGPYQGVVGQQTIMDGSASRDPDGTITKYRWETGDGKVYEGSGNMLAHIYTAPGTYTVTLTVTDDQGATGTATTTATITAAPQPPGELVVSVTAVQQSTGAIFTGVVRGTGQALPAGSKFTVIVRTPDDRTGTAEDTLEDTSTPVPPEPPPSSVLFTETFEGSSIGDAWKPGVIVSGSAAIDPLVKVTWGGGRLTITPRVTTGQHYNGILTRAGYDLTGAAVSVEVVQSTAGSANTQFALVKDPLNFFLMETEGGALFCAQVVAGIRNDANVPYSASQHRWWRIRHNGSDTIIFETSADGVTWTARRALPRGFAISALTVELTAGSWERVASPGVAVFDNVRVER